MSSSLDYSLYLFSYLKALCNNVQGYKIRILHRRLAIVCHVFLCQEKFTTRHELALLRVSALMGLVMFGGMSSLFYTQMAGILSVSTES